MLCLDFALLELVSSKYSQNCCFNEKLMQIWLGLNQCQEKKNADAASSMLRLNSILLLINFLITGSLPTLTIQKIFFHNNKDLIYTFIQKQQLDKNNYCPESVRASSAMWVPEVFWG